jgi:DNA-binding transcriptional LysR family regulator
LLNALLTRDLDLAIALNPPARPGITAVELGRTAIVCVCPPDDPDARQPIDLAAFLARDWISIGNTDPLGELIGNALEAQGLDESVAAVEAQTWYVARALAARGIGYALLDELTARSGAEPVAIRPVTPALSAGVFALWRDGGMDSQAGNAFLDVLRAPFA